MIFKLVDLCFLIHKTTVNVKGRKGSKAAKKRKGRNEWDVAVCVCVRARARACAGGRDWGGG